MTAFSSPEPSVRLAGEAWARGLGGSGDTGFEALDFRTSGHFGYKSKLEDSLSKALNHLNLQALTLRQEQVNAMRNVVRRKSEMTRRPKIKDFKSGLCP